MPPPPLSAHERRLGTFALISAVVYGGAGLFFAVLPRLTLKIAASGQHIDFMPGARLWHALAVSMMAMLTLCCALVAQKPRENRRLLLVVILSKAVSTGMALLSIAFAHASSPEAHAGIRTLWTTVTTDFPLFLATAYFYWKAAPGIAAEAQPQSVPQDEPAQRPVALGIAKAAGSKGE
jgi:hypothetical protein